MKKISGFSLLEILIVVAIFAVISSVIFGTMDSARVGFASASNQINRQQEARRAVNRISEDLKMTNPFWDIGGTSYLVTISHGGNQIDFYLPVFDNNEIISLTAVRYFIGGINNSQLLRREGGVNTVIANDINVGFQGEALFAFDNSPDNTVININVPVIKKDATFVLTSKVNLRNRQIELDDEVEVEAIIEQ